MKRRTKVLLSLIYLKLCKTTEIFVRNKNAFFLFNFYSNTSFLVYNFNIYFMSLKSDLLQWKKVLYIPSLLPFFPVALVCSGLFFCFFLFLFLFWIFVVFFSFLFSFRQKDLYVLRVAVKNVFKSITYRTYVSDLPTCFILEFMRAGYYLRQSVCLFNIIKS